MINRCEDHSQLKLKSLLNLEKCPSLTKLTILDPNIILTCTCTSCINKYIIAYIQCTYINTYIHAYIVHEKYLLYYRCVLFLILINCLRSILKNKVKIFTGLT